MSKHTPGPWSFDPQDTHFSFCGPEKRPATNPDYDFRVEFSDHVSAEEQAATVRLISAVPELLGALQYWLDAACDEKLEQCGEQWNTSAKFDRGCISPVGLCGQYVTEAFGFGEARKLH